MANNTASNITRPLMRRFLKAFDANRVITKSIDTQMFKGKFEPKAGTVVDVKRPHDYRTSRTPDGDLTSETKSSIISGKASATVQDFFTGSTEWGNIEEATSLDQLDKILAPMATRIITDLEVDLATYMMKNAGLAYGTPGTAIDAWTDISGAGALMDSIGVPKDMMANYVLNPYSAANLASAQYGLSPGGGNMVKNAWERAMVDENMGGMRVMKSNALASRAVTTAADLVGALTGAPTLTYLGAKDTMQQAWSVTGFTASATVKAGDVIQVTGKYRCSLSTRQPVFDGAGAQILFRAIVTEDVVLGSSGEGILVMSAPAIYEAAGQYNTTTAGLGTDVLTILGTSATTVQPALFYHPQAFTLATVKLPKLYSTDTVAVTEDGIAIRCSKYSDGDKNKQKVRFDLLPAYGTLNPFFAGQGFGV